MKNSQGGMWRAFATAAIAAAICAGGCTETPQAHTGDGAPPPGPDAAGGSLGPQGTPSVRDETHAGWSDPRCDSCHNLPEKGHLATHPAQCARCHGANGACNPNGPNSGRQEHAKDNDCGSCHDRMHEIMNPPGDCVSCHFAAAATVDCPPPVVVPDGGPADGALVPPDGGGIPPQLAGGLKSGCLGWPGTEFSPSNSTGWIVSVSAGQLAIDFTLKDTAGTSHTLSDLLGTKPVWLQLGSFT